MSVTPLVSLIAPVHNGGAFIAQSAHAIARSLSALDGPFELIIVSDGSTDDTATRARSAGLKEVVVLEYDGNRGKGYAICAGISHARGKMVGWLDADLDISPDVIVAAARKLQTGEFDAVVGSKRHRQSQVQYPLTRRVLSSGYQLLTRLLFRVNVRDTQVGAKLFRREMLDVVAPLLLVKRYAFDIEVLAVGAEFGFDRLAEVPVDLQYRFTGTGVGAPAVRLMFKDTLAIGYRIHLRHWYVRQYAKLQRERAEALANQDETPPVPPRGTLAEVRNHLR